MKNIFLQEIFNIPFKKGDQYKRGQSANHPDEIRSANGTYRLSLNATSRTTFHEALDKCIRQLDALQQSNRSSDESDQEEDSRYNNEVKQEPKRVIHVEPDTPDSTIASPKGKIFT